MPYTIFGTSGCEQVRFKSGLYSELLVLFKPYLFGNCQFLGLDNVADLIFLMDAVSKKEFDTYLTDKLDWRHGNEEYDEESYATGFTTLVLNPLMDHVEKVESFFGKENVLFQSEKFKNLTGRMMCFMLIDIAKYLKIK